MQRTPHESSHGHHDVGSTFIEILVAIVLLGTVVVATLTGLRASIIGSEIDEDSSRAQAWLQAATDEIYGTGYLDCTLNTAAQIESGYQSAVNSATRPNEWASGATITITSVQYLSGTGTTETWGPHGNCATASAANPIYPQLVTIEVVDPQGDFTATIEVIKSV